jgi:hypothetical protein
VFFFKSHNFCFVRGYFKKTNVVLIIDLSNVDVL